MTTYRLLRRREFKPFVVSVLLLAAGSAVAAALFWRAAPIRDWRYVRAHGERLPGTVVEGDDVSSYRVRFTDTADHSSRTVDTDYDPGEVGERSDVLYVRGHPPQLVDETVDPRPAPQWLRPAEALLAGGLGVAILLGTVAALARAHRRAAWRPATAQVLDTGAPTYVVVDGTRVVRMLWDDALPALDGDVEVSGDPERDAVLVLRSRTRNDELYWPLDMSGRESYDVAALATRPADPPEPVRRPTRLRQQLTPMLRVGLVLVPVLGFRLGEGEVVDSAAFAAGAAAALVPLGIVSGWSPRRAGRFTVRSAASRRIRGGNRAPWYVRRALFLGVAVVAAGVAGAGFGYDARRPDVASWRDVAAAVEPGGDPIRTERVAVRYDLDGRTYRTSVRFASPARVEGIEGVTVRVDPHDAAHAVPDPGTYWWEGDEDGVAYAVAFDASVVAAVSAVLWLLVAGVTAGATARRERRAH